MREYAFLLVAIIFEVSGTLLLPVSDNFSKVLPTTTLVVCYILSFYCLTVAISRIPLAIAYSSWAGLGVLAIALLSYFLYKQTLTWQAVVGLFLIVAGVVLVNSFKTQTV